MVFETIYNDDLDAGIGDPADPNSGSLFAQMYEDDDEHTTLLGSYIQALTIYASITGKDVSKVQYKPPSQMVCPEMAAKARDLVSRTIQATLDDTSIRYPWQDEPWQDSQPSAI